MPRSLTRFLFLAGAALLWSLGVPTVACGQGTLPVPDEEAGLTPAAVPSHPAELAPGAPDAAAVPTDEAGAAGLPPTLEGQLGWLGVSLLATSREAAKDLGYGQPLIEVDIVFAGSPAEVSGFRTGDLIVEFAGEPVFQIQDLVDRVKATPPGSKVTFKRLRDGKEEDVPVLLGVRPEMYGLLRDHFVDLPAPDFVVSDLKSGASIKLSELRGSVVLLDYWATWCGPCRRSVPQLAAMYTRHAKEGLVVVGISDEEAGPLNEFLAETPLPYAIGLDPDRAAHRAYMVNALPTLYLIGRDGVVRAVFIGADELESIDKGVRAALAEPPG